MAASFDELWTDFLEGELDASGMQTLNELLQSDEGLLQTAADLYEEHRLLGLMQQPFDRRHFVQSILNEAASDRKQFVDRVLNDLSDAKSADRENLPGRPHEGHGQHIGRTSMSFRKIAGAVLTGATAVILVLAARSILAPNASVQPSADDPSFADVSAPSRESIATLLLAEDCLWDQPRPPEEGQRLAQQQLQLLAGLAVIRFDGGAELVMSGAASVRLDTTARASLLHGEVIVRAEDGADGFELVTPASPLIDLGTEFAARVDRVGNTDVHVLDGRVEMRRGTESEVLSAGRRLRLPKSDQSVQPAKWHSKRFHEVLQAANPKPQPQRMWAYEGFHYDEGPLPLTKTTRGLGWAGPWRLRLPDERRLPDREESPKQFDIVHGQLNVTWPVPGGRLGMLQLPPGAAYYVRPLKRKIRLDRNGQTYFSLMVRETERTDSRGQRERLRLTFRSSQDYFGECLSFGHGPGYRPHVQSGPGVSHTSSLLLPIEETTLWVGKIVSRKHGDDEVYFRVYGESDELGYAEPATWHVVTRGTQLEAQLDRVLLSSNGTTSRVIDELRIGPTWRSVAPMKTPQEFSE